MKCEKYYLGLDIGTDSVGYAATDGQYSLLKYHGEPMWGVTLFDEAQLNTERRGFRTARRRLDRRQQRIDLLQELFAHAVANVDDRFFIRLKGSALNRDDTDDADPVFDGFAYSDAQYHKDYPTIHHLICELMSDDQPHDVRLVYLACAWLVAHRGHFLSEIAADRIEICDFNRVYKDFQECFSAFGDEIAIPWKHDNDTLEKLQNALKERNTVSVKYREISGILFDAPKAPRGVETFPTDLEITWKMICGSKVEAKKLFGKEEYAEVESFSLDSDDEKIASLLEQLEDDDKRVILCAKAMSDWALLANSLSGCNSVSEAKVCIYEQHKEDLRYLKAFVRKYLPQKFNEIFRIAGENNYVAYSYHYKNGGHSIPGKKASKEDFSKYLLKIVSGVEPEEDDRDRWEDMKHRLELRTFLPKQKDTDNRVIPHQLYLWELNEILSRAKDYLPFLSERDETGLSVSDKIKSVFSFRVPYFVGPLNRHSQNSWIRFKAEKSGRILPWNYADIVDEDACEEEFIRRMTNKCTYLPEKNVLPKDSLLYHKFTVLNEINNLTIDGEAISVEVKQGIYNELFAKQRKVTRKKIESYLLSINAMVKGQTLGGIDDTVKSDLKPWHDFKRLLETEVLTEKQVECIIERRTYSDDRTRFEKWLREEYPRLSDEDVRYISRLSYRDFGRLSKEFLTELSGTNKKSDTGEALSIIQSMWETNNNLMELLSDRFTFKETIEELQREYYAEHSGSLNKELDEMYISNAVKRPVIRSLEIVKEVVKALGSAPEKIFVEMARGGKPEQKGKRTKSRKEQILELYDQCREEDVRLLRQELEKMGEDADSRLHGDWLFLYYMQLGKCMYTGNPIDVSKRKDGTYNIDHIYPQAYVKDDSILNNKVLVTSEANGIKGDKYPVPAEFRQKMHGFWSVLHQNGLISDEKFKRLTRSTPFSDEEKIGFINRQLTETSQSTKAVAALLKKYYPNTEIVYVKARLVSEFRQEFDLLKSRTYNDLHHAKDAYLNIVIGNVYDMKFSKRWFDVRQDYSVKTRTIFVHPVICHGETVWDGPKMLEKVKHTVRTNHAHETVYSFRKHHGQNGGFFDQNPLKKQENLIPLKKELPTEKYGGYGGVTTASFCLVRVPSGKKNEVLFFPVELLSVNKFFSDVDYAHSFVKQKLQLKKIGADAVEFPLGLREIKINTQLSIDGYRVCLSAGSLKDGRLYFYPIVPFVKDYKTEAYIKRLEVFNEKAANAKKMKKTYIYDQLHDVVNVDDNVKLYGLYIDKLKGNGLMSKRPKANDLLICLEKHKQDFESLNIEKQVYTLLQIHSFFGRNSAGIDMTALGESKSACITRENLRLSNWKEKYRDVRIIDSSASGLWEKRSENLLDLL